MSHDAYSALSDPTRRRILAVLQDGARPVGDLVTELGVSQPTVSKHLKVLRDAGMVTTRAQGQKRFYSIVADPLVPVVDWLTELVAAAQSAPDDDAAAPAPQPAASEPAEHEDSVTSEEEVPGSPEPLTSEQTMPWSTAEVSETPETIESEEQDGAVEQEDQGAVVAAEDSGEASQEAPEDGAVMEAEGESEGAAASVEGDARADTTVQPGLSSESGPGGVAPRDAFEQVVASENGEPMRPRGGAHRRQSGLLSTLTGFRRRGRGSRRD